VPRTNLENKNACWLAIHVGPSFQSYLNAKSPHTAWAALATGVGKGPAGQTNRVALRALLSGCPASRAFAPGASPEPAALAKPVVALPDDAPVDAEGPPVDPPLLPRPEPEGAPRPGWPVPDGSPVPPVLCPVAPSDSHSSRSRRSRLCCWSTRAQQERARGRRGSPK